MFAVLMVIQWLAGIIFATWLSPFTWSGTESQIHPHVWAALFLGSAISLFPIVLALTRPGRKLTRYVVAVGQMLMGALLIHLTGGRIETHFHVFGSLAFLAFYRDWRVLVPATLIVVFDHFFRGIFFPQSVFGVLTASGWRVAEHAGWVAFIDIFLVISCLRSTREMHDIAKRTAEQMQTNENLQTEIIERKRIEGVLEEAARRERAMIENAVDVVCTIDGEGKFVTVSPSCLTIWGYSPEELIGRRYIEFVVPEDVDKTNEAGVRIMNGEPATDFQNRYRHKNGSEIHITWTAYWSEREQLMFSIAHDTTQRNIDDEKLRTFAAELKRSNNELQDFASVASHDLQEPLRKIQSFADELKISLGERIEDDDLDTLERMVGAAGRMRTLINDLLTFSRVTTMAKPFVPVDLSLITGEVLSDLEVRTRDTGGVIEVDPLPVIDADPVQMRQLIQNLVGNGLKFHRQGVAPIIRISGKNGGPNCRLTVADNGIGFDEKYLDRIFTIFQRLHSRNEYEGTGIGLAVCRKIVERHGGEITARSTPGEGTTFIITLPMKHTKEENL